MKILELAPCRELEVKYVGAYASQSDDTIWCHRDDYIQRALAAAYKDNTGGTLSDVSFYKKALIHYPN